MFKYSKNWLERLAGEKIDIKDFDKNWLDLQGFEVATETPVGDDVVVELEVKANRPDMLSHIGVLREYNVYKHNSKMPEVKSKLSLEGLKDLDIKVEVLTDKVDNLVLIEIKNVDNTKETPKYMKDYLEALGVSTINPIVDISNYIMLELGQPIHMFDLDKVKDKLCYKLNDRKQKIITLSGEEEEIPENAIVIEDSEGITCLAGIVGTQKVEIDENTKNIIIESAHFDNVASSIASHTTHITTLASYRFERGVDSDQALNYGLLCAEKVLEICGGTITGAFALLQEKEKNIKEISVKKTNSLLGTNLSAKEIKTLLEKYYYSAEILNDDTVKVYCPDYRLDLEQNVDVIADVAQMYGYHNIVPTNPNLSVNYEPNIVMDNSDRLRDILLGLGVNECISYTFIHKEALTKLGINKESKLYGDIELLNPLSIKFAIMRPNMLYSMLNTLLFNISKYNECEPIFEIGTVFERNNSTDTGYSQKQMLSVLLNGTKIPKGFGIDKNIPYDFYDIKQILELIMDEFSLNYELKETNESVLEKGLEIYINGKYSGLIGTVDNSKIKNLENGKLVKGEVQYLELCVDNLIFGRTALEVQSKFQSIIREYNLLVPNGVKFSDYSKEISKISPVIKEIIVNDIYNGKGVKENHSAILIQIEYSSLEKTLTFEEIETLEKQMLEKLKSNFNIELKM